MFHRTMPFGLARTSRGEDHLLSLSGRLSRSAVSRKPKVGKTILCLPRNFSSHSIWKSNRVGMYLLPEPPWTEAGHAFARRDFGKSDSLEVAQHAVAFGKRTTSIKKITGENRNLVYAIFLSLRMLLLNFVEPWTKVHCIAFPYWWNQLILRFLNWKKVTKINQRISFFKRDSPKYRFVTPS